VLEIWYAGRRRRRLERLCRGIVSGWASGRQTGPFSQRRSGTGCRGGDAVGRPRRTGWMDWPMSRRRAVRALALDALLHKAITKTLDSGEHLSTRRRLSRGRRRVVRGSHAAG
jgi:hypothetical protein